MHKPEMKFNETALWKGTHVDDLHTAVHIYLNNFLFAFNKKITSKSVKEQI